MRAAKHGSIGNATRVVIQFAMTAFLARLLGPAAFGAIAACWILLGTARLFCDFGLSAAIVQIPAIEQEDIDAAFTLQLLFGTLLTGGLWICADAVATALGQQGIENIIRGMSLLFVVQAFSQIPQALLTRNFRIGTIQVCQIGSYLAAYLLIGVPAAIEGLGAWSLVMAQVAQAVVNSVAMYAAVNAGPRIGSIRPAYKMAKFGGQVVAANVTSWLLMNFDSIILSRQFGATALGLYNRALSLVSTPANVLTGALQTAIFTSVSRASSSTREIAVAYSAMIELLLLLVLPAFAVLAAEPETVVIAIYGEKWSAAAPILAPLSLAMPFYVLLCTIGPLLMALDRVSMELRAQVVAAAIMVPSILMVAQISILAVAWAMLAVNVLRCGALVEVLRRTLNLPWRILLRCSVFPTSCAAACGSVASIVAELCSDWSPLPRLGAILALGSVTWIVLILLLSGRLLSGRTRSFLVTQLNEQSGLLAALVRNARFKTGGI